uniref:Protein ARV n=1 Tax=Glossina morsitans morsitans TaxID=37546 RepID=A0A1B0FMD5_GLOMM
MNFKPTFICINCGCEVKELYKKYSNVIKTVNCEKCHKIVDKYVEFEPVIILLDTVLLSQQAYRHILYNRDFKLFWKLSLMLLLLESFALWREKREQPVVRQKANTTYEQGFYMCCFQNIIDNLLCTMLLFTITLLLHTKWVLEKDMKRLIFTLLKANTLANFSKFFLLPIILWRENTTEFDINLHRIIVMAHHLCAQTFVYVIVSRLARLRALVVIIVTYFVKKFILQYAMNILEHRLTQ